MNSLRIIRQRLKCLDTDAETFAKNGQLESAAIARNQAEGIRLVLPELVASLDVIGGLRDYISSSRYDKAFDYAEAHLESHGVA